MADPIPDYIKGYRAGESLPKKFEIEDILKMSAGIGAALKAGMPTTGATTYLNRVLLEGRADAGANSYNTNNPRAKKLYQTLSDQGVSEPAAIYAAAILDKTEVAKRLGISFDEAWNGTGVSQYGTTGKDYADRAALFAKVQDDPRNAGLRDVITRGITGSLSPREATIAKTDDQILSEITGIPTSELTTNYGIYSDPVIQKLGELKKNAVTALAGASDSLPADPDFDKLLATNPKFVASRLVHQIKTAAYNDTNTTGNPVYDVIAGLDPEGKNFTAAHPNPSMLSEVKDFLSSLFQQGN